MKSHIKLEKEVYRAWRKRFIPGKISAYEKEADRFFANVKFEKSSEKELIQKLKAAQILVFGDDSLVPQDQERIVHLLKQLRLDSAKTVFVTNRKEISDPLASWVKKRKIAIRRTENNDRSLAKRIAEIAEKGLRIIVWTGAQRLAAKHLPSLLKKYAGIEHFIVFQTPALRFRSNAERDWVSLGTNYTSWVGSSSLVALAYRRAWNDHAEHLLYPDQLRSEFLKYCNRISNMAHVASVQKSSNVYTAFHLEEWSLPCSLFLIERIKNGESAVIPAKKIVLLSSLEEGHIAEEAGHYVRMSSVRHLLTDTYSVALEEALGFLASLWIDPTRRIPPLIENSDWAKVHVAGYRLGKRLNEKWNNSNLWKRNIRELWRIRPQREEEAWVLWYQIQKKMKG